TEVIGSATVLGGAAPYSLQFYLDNVAQGGALVSPPFTRNFGTLPVGDHSVRAAVTDAHGWTSNSLASVIHVTGPLGGTLAPTNGASYVFGESIVLTAVPGGGVPPYAVDFFTNDQQ